MTGRINVSELDPESGSDGHGIVIAAGRFTVGELPTGGGGGGGAMFINVVVAHGAVGDGITDDTAAFTDAIAAAVAAGGGVVYAPGGTYKITSQLTWKTGVSLVGDGIDATILKGVGANFSVIRNTTDYSLASPLTGALFRDFTIDGSAMTVTAYESYYKGFYIRFLRDCRWVRVKVLDTPATGFGVDFLVDCSFIDCIAEGCGRLNNGSQPGGAGFGIGAGAADTENVLISGCIARDNGRSGIFFERQTVGIAGVLSRYARVVDCHVTGNQYGIVNAGVRDFHVQGNTVVDSTLDGISIRQMLYSGRGADTLIQGNTVARNTGHGITLDDADGAGTYTLGLRIDSNQVSGNGKRGINLASDATTVKFVDIHGNTVRDNGRVGIGISGSSSWTDVSAQGNNVAGNGTASVAGETAGILLQRPITRGVITDNNITGHSGYGLSATGNLTSVDLTGNLLAGNGGTYQATGTNTDVQLPGSGTSPGGTGGVGELLMEDGATAPPVPLETETRDDWLYQG